MSVKKRGPRPVVDFRTVQLYEDNLAFLLGIERPVGCTDAAWRRLRVRLIGEHPEADAKAEEVERMLDARGWR